MPGARCTRSLACASEKMHASIHSEAPEITRHSRTQWFTAYLVLSPERSCSLASVAPQITDLPDPVEPNQPPRDLTPAFEAPGPHVFTVRVSIVRLACQVITHEEQSALQSPGTRDTGRVHRISSRVRDDRDTPLCG
jgi:hypothetical protein